MKILKVLLLISAGITVVLRLFTYENSSFMSQEAVRICNIICIAAAAVCVACAAIWVIKIKKDEKKQKNDNETDIDR